MSSRSELKENILAAKLEKVLTWVLEHRNVVLTALGVTVVAILISSVFIIRNKEIQTLNHTRLAQAQSLIAQQKFSQADQVLKEIKSSSVDKPFSALVSYYRGLAMVGLKNFDKGAQFFMEAVESGGNSPLVPLALINQGFSYEENKDYDMAATLYGRFMSDYGDHFMAPRVQLALGRCLGFGGKTEESRKALEQLIDLYPTSVWAENARYFLDKIKTR